jgi:hypothetical protein
MKIKTTEEFWADYYYGIDNDSNNELKNKLDNLSGINLLTHKTMNDYDLMRAELKRLHGACRAKDQTIKDAIITIESFLSNSTILPSHKELAEKRVKDFRDALG